MRFSGDFDRIAQTEARSAAARNIFNEVEDWRGTKRAIANKRWIWELLQNAKDCAKGKPFSFSVTLKKNSLVIQHDAGPFHLRDIVALVEGDSSKHRRAEDTTGKFGKGFLVSHVVATDVEVNGILADQKQGKFSFRFRLRRDGSEAAIRHNIEQCRDALDDVKPFKGDSCLTQFTYAVQGGDQTRECLEEAVRNLKNHAAYLFSFIPELKRINVELPGQPVLIFASDTRQRIDAGPLAASVEKIAISTPDSIRNVLLFTTQTPSGSKPQIAFELNPDNRILTPTVIARVFQDLPLHATADFDLPVVLNIPSTCDVDSDRAGPNLTKDETYAAVHTSLALLPSVVNWVRRQKIGGAHLLAECGISEEMNKEPQMASRWMKSITEVVKALSVCKLVECATGFLCVDEASFPDAAWLESVPSDIALLHGTHRLLLRRGDNVPAGDTVEEWESILTKWTTIPNAPRGRRVSLNSLFGELHTSESLEGLRRRHFTSKESALTYLCELFQVAADYCKRQNIDAPAGLKNSPVLLNQNGRFREGKALNLDDGIDGVLKDLSDQISLSLRDRLVDRALSDSAGGELVSQLCGDKVFKTGNAVGGLVTEIERRFTAGQVRGADGQVLAKAAVTFLAWFAANPSYAPDDLQSFPLLCADGRLHAATEYHDTFLAPTQMFSEQDQSWIDLFPQSVRLSDEYLKACDIVNVPSTTLAAFCDRHSLASASLLFRREVSSDAEHFSTMYRDKADSGHRVDSISVTDIAGFTRLLSETAGASSSGDTQKAERVLTFILSYATVKDESWKSLASASCSRAHRCAGSVSLFPCSWLAKAKHSHWVPSTEAGGPCEPLSSRNIKEMWERLPAEVAQAQETRDFLALHFGVDRLEMAIRASAGDDGEKRAELRDELASVVDSGVDPAELREFVARHRSASEINTRNGKLGRIVESLVREAFEREGFDVVRTGTGSDFKITLAEAKDFELERQDVGELTFRATYNGVPVEYLVEIKATQGDVVRMSWRQAETAASNIGRYILCVVDFREHSDLFDRVLEEDRPTCDIISDCIGLVPSIGDNLAVSVRNLSAAVETEDPGIEVEKAEEIRFRVLRPVWASGSGLNEWATSVKEQIARPKNAKRTAI